MTLEERLQLELDSPDTMATHWTARRALCRDALTEIARLKEQARVRRIVSFVAVCLLAAGGAGVMVSAHGLANVARTAIEGWRQCVARSGAES